MTIGALKALPAGAKAAEHVVADFASKLVQACYNKLPAAMQPAARGAFMASKLATAAYFASYKAGQALVEKVSLARGSTPEQASKLRGICTAIDVVAAKASMIALESLGAGHHALIANSFIPYGSTAYLLGSLARNPVKTAATAVKAVAGMFKKSGNRDDWGELETRSEQTPRMDATAFLNAIADRMEAHEWSDDYHALICAAIGEVGAHDGDLADVIHLLDSIDTKD